MALLGEAKHQSQINQIPIFQEPTSEELPDTVDELKAQVIALKEELSQYRQALQDAANKNNAGTNQKAQLQRQLSHRDYLIHDLSNVVFNSKLPINPNAGHFPYRIASNYVVFSTDESWLNNMHAKLPDILFFSKLTKANCKTIRTADTIWIQPKDMTFDEYRYILAEARNLEKEGVSELILVAQDVTRYGIDFDGKSHLVELVDNLSAMDFDRIRLLYLEPEAITDDIIEMIVSNPKVVKYADVPLQHIDNDTLKRMGRRCDEPTTRALIKKMREKGIILRSSFICGFPGETEEAHNKLVEFIREGNIDYAGFFAYSREEGTPADRMQDHLDEDVKVARTNRLKDLQTAVINNRNNNLIGKTIKVLFDEIDYDKQMFVGRADFQAPDIDNLVYFTADKEVHVGEYYDVEIVGADGIDLVGKVL
jgi:hypothetical protein